MLELEPGGRNSPRRGGGEGGERGPGPRRPLPPRPRGGTGTAAPGSLARGTPGEFDASEAQAGLPGRASLRVLGPPAAHNAPGRGLGTVVPLQRSPPQLGHLPGRRAAAPPTVRRQRREAADGPGGRESARAGRELRRGAACVDPRSPAPTAAVTLAGSSARSLTM